MEAKELSWIPPRVALGATMLYHGASKLRADGRAETASQFGAMGLRPGKFWGLATGLAEVFAGASAILGLGTRLSALAVLVTQGMAIAKVHAPKGFNTVRGGYEFNLALMAIALALLVSGPGDVSAQGLLQRRQARGLLKLRMRERRAERWMRWLQ